MPYPLIQYKVIQENSSELMDPLCWTCTIMGSPVFSHLLPESYNLSYVKVTEGPFLNIENTIIGGPSSVEETGDVTDICS